MNNYLYKHYKGKYRVLADYDWDTNDFPRDEQGNIDEDFNDFYIPGKKNIEIRHASQNVLGCYIFSIGLGRNVLASIYEQELNKQTPKKLEKIADDLICIIKNAQDKDGYLNTYYTIKDSDKRWTNLHERHLLCRWNFL